MVVMDIIIEPLDRSHNRSTFDSGIEELNAFLKKYARQNLSQNINKTYVAIESNQSHSNSKNILGFYTLSSGQIDQSCLPQTEKHPRYPVSIARLARLAVSLDHQSCGISARLLHDALSKVSDASKLIGIYAVVVDAKDITARSFYEHYGFIRLQDSDLTLFLPMKIINQLAD